MSTSFNKNGNILSSSFIDGTGGNILKGTKYTINSPYILTGTGTDIIANLDNVTRVTPGKTYYVTCKTDKAWASEHKGSKDEVTIWLYLRKTYDESNYGYDYPVLFSKKGGYHIKDGLWKITIPDGYVMGRIRLNTYSDGTTSVTSKFWDIALIPEEDFCNESTIPMKISNDKIISNEIIEI